MHLWLRMQTHRSHSVWTRSELCGIELPGLETTDACRPTNKRPQPNSSEEPVSAVLSSLPYNSQDSWRKRTRRREKGSRTHGSPAPSFVKALSFSCSTHLKGTRISLKKGRQMGLDFHSKLPLKSHLAEQPRPAERAWERAWQELLSGWSSLGFSRPSGLQCSSQNKAPQLPDEKSAPNPRADGSEAERSG